MLAGMDRETGKPRGFAHVQFESVEGAAAAIGKNGTELMGRDLFIDSAQERPQSGATPGRQQRGGEPSCCMWKCFRKMMAESLVLRCCIPESLSCPTMSTS